jgi:hypothetical protein
MSTVKFSTSATTVLDSFELEKKCNFFDWYVVRTQDGFFISEVTTTVVNHEEQNGNYRAKFGFWIRWSDVHMRFIASYEEDIRFEFSLNRIHSIERMSWYKVICIFRNANLCFDGNNSGWIQNLISDNRVLRLDTKNKKKVMMLDIYCDKYLDKAPEIRVTTSKFVIEYESLNNVHSFLIPYVDEWVELETLYECGYNVELQKLAKNRALAYSHKQG